MSENNRYQEFLNKAHLCESSGQWQAALVLYDEAIALYPGIIDLYYRRANVRFKLNAYQEALEDYTRVLEIDPSHSRAYFWRGYLSGFHFSDYASALEDLHKISISEPFMHVACLYAGIIYYNKRDFKNAEIEYNKALERNPGYGEAFFFRAMLFDDTDERLKALADYSAALKNGYTCSQLHYNRGLLYAKFGNFSQAMEDFTHSCAIAPYMDTSVSKSACLYYTDGRPSVAEYIFPDPPKTANFSYYLEQGFVRFANYFFRHNCEGCKACIPLRVLADKFIMTKSLKRTAKQNSDLRVVILDTPVIDCIRINLFEKYNKEKHNTDSGEHLERQVAFRHFGFKNSYELDFYLDDNLIAVSILNEGADALYSSACYYDTAYLKRRLGIFTIIKEIELAQKLGKSFYYIGWYIEDIPKMSYKKQFRPNQLLIANQWQDFCL